MGDLSKEAIGLLTHLMPGFLTAWVVYGLTTYSKPSQFERIVQALIYSFLVNGLVAAIEAFANWLGTFIILGTWSKNVELITSTTVALLLGLALSYFMRNPSFFALARRLRLTQRTQYPSEWYGAFAERPRYLVLHLDGNLRLAGYPIEWPTEPTSGHFRITNAAWLNQDNTEVPLPQNDSMLIEARKVHMVELLKDEKELEYGPETA